MDGIMRRGPLSDLTQYINPDINNTRVQNAIGNHTFGFPRKTAKPDTYKTVMCQAWLESMKCSFGENCKFAHGEHELRPVRFTTQVRNNLKYKTKLCDKYTTTGICPYGSRCLFIHPAPCKTPSNSYSSSDEASALQQQLEMIRQQYGPNSLPDMKPPTMAPQPPPPQMTHLWSPSGFFDQKMALPQRPAHPIPQAIQQQNFGSRRSFSTSSAPSSAFGSSNSLGSTGTANNPSWPWNDDLSLASLSPPFGQGLSQTMMGQPGLQCNLQSAAPHLQSNHLAFHNSMPTFGPAPGTFTHQFGLMRSTPGSLSSNDDDPFMMTNSPMSGTEEQGEQLARSVARALEIDL
uniref:Zinc finger protein n=1 Tax=Bursaphelenchus xylophilus TaxID=6326 RepID=A0A1I7SX94_BURXY